MFSLCCTSVSYSILYLICAVSVSDGYVQTCGWISMESTLLQVPYGTHWSSWRKKKRKTNATNTEGVCGSNHLSHVGMGIVYWGTHFPFPFKRPLCMHPTTRAFSLIDNRFAVDDSMLNVLIWSAELHRFCLWQFPVSQLRFADFVLHLPLVHHCHQLSRYNVLCFINVTFHNDLVLSQILHGPLLNMQEFYLESVFPCYWGANIGQ